MRLDKHLQSFLPADSECVAILPVTFLCTETHASLHMFEESIPPLPVSTFASLVADETSCRSQPAALVIALSGCLGGFSLGLYSGVVGHELPSVMARAHLPCI